VLQWATRRASPALIFELGRYDGAVLAVAVLPDGRVVTGRAIQACAPVTRSGRRPPAARRENAALVTSGKH
jgi:hypothetical protein